MDSQLTIIVLSYNNERFIQKNMQSIIDGFSNDVQVIINDDNSTDKSLSIIKKFIFEKDLQKKNWMVNENKKNIGINASIQNALLLTKSNWVKLIAGDDEFEKNSINYYKDLALKNSPEKKIFISHLTIIDELSNVIGFKKSPSKMFFENKYLKTTNLYINTLNAPGVMIGRCTLQTALKQTRARNAEDWPVLRYCIINNFSFEIIEEKLVKYRHHQKSLSSFYNLKAIKNDIYEDVVLILEENSNYSSHFFVKYGIFIQRLKMQSAFKVVTSLLQACKYLNIQFIVFKLCRLIYK